jgi:hypothetical protein
MALGVDSAYQEYSCGVKAGRRVRPTAICEQIVYRKYGSLDVSQPYEPSLPVTGIALPYLYLMK